MTGTGTGGGPHANRDRGHTRGRIVDEASQITTEPRTRIERESLILGEAAVAYHCTLVKAHRASATLGLGPGDMPLKNFGEPKIAIQMQMK